MNPPPARVPAWYALAWRLALPAVALYLLWRSLRQPEYRRHWGERFLGAGAPIERPRGAALIWLHAVSLGETRAAQPLLEALAQAHPQAQFLLTHMTPTGRAAGAELARRLPGRVHQRYLPYDLGFAVRRFMRELRPDVGLLMETEIWPRLLQEAAAVGLPMLLVNARLSARSLAKGLRFERLLRAAGQGLRAVGAQSEADAGRLRRLYAGPVEVTGNLKFDLQPDAALQARGQALRARLRALAARPVWLFASTREGEERLLLEALAQRVGQPRPWLVFVPRHPQRFDEVAGLLQELGAAPWRRASWDVHLAQDAPVPEPPRLLGDSMGEMPLYYALADVAFIGGSLLPFGGQNLIEACACGCPVVLGPHCFNFAQASADALQAGAAQAVADADQAIEALARISGDAGLQARMAEAARAFAAAHRGATGRTVQLVGKVLENPLSRRAGEG